MYVFKQLLRVHAIIIKTLLRLCLSLISATATLAKYFKSDVA